MSSKFLVFTNAFGKQVFFDLAVQMISTLRRHGYTGDVAVITDKPFDFPSPLSVMNLVLPGIDENTLVKASLASIMDVNSYEKILFVDSDVIFVKSPDALFSLGSGRISISYHHRPLKLNDFNLSFMLASERGGVSLEKHISINTGIIVFPADKFSECMESWNTYWKTRKLQRKLAFSRGLPHPGDTESSQCYLERDQPALQAALILDKMEYEAIPDNLFIMPLHTDGKSVFGAETVAIHFCGVGRMVRDKNSILQLMKEFSELPNYEAVRLRCHQLQTFRKVGPVLHPIPVFLRKSKH